MGMMSKLLTAGALATVMAAGAAQAATVNISGTNSTTGSGVNNFAGALSAALGGAAQLVAPASISSVGPVILTFSYVASESGYANSFNAIGAGPLNEPAGGIQQCGPNLLNCSFASVSGTYSGLIDGLLSFTSDLGTYGLGDKEFGVFTQGGVGAHSVFFLAFDDNGAGPDDNHDDFLIRVNVAAVPVPAAGFLLIGALGGLAALRRRKTA